MNSLDQTSQWLADFEVESGGRWTDPARDEGRVAISLAIEADLAAMAGAGFVSNVVLSVVEPGTQAVRPSWGHALGTSSTEFGAWRATAKLVEGQLGSGPPVKQNHLVLERKNQQLLYAVFSCASALFEAHEGYFKQLTEELIRSLVAALD